MKEITIQTSINVYDSITELNDSDQLLLQKTVEATEKSYAPFSNFKVGAAARLRQVDEIVQGANQENAAYPMCLCAEMVLLSAVSSIHPNAIIDTIGITVKSEDSGVQQPVSPCGACRQTLLEFEGRQQTNIRLLLLGQDGTVYELSSVKDLLPLSFDASYLQS